MDKNQKKCNLFSGKFILEQFRKFGSAMEQKHEMTFWIYFPSENKAQQAGIHAKNAGLNPQIIPPRNESFDSQWLCLLYCSHVPDEEILDGITGFCIDLASDYGGVYDGWESRLELNNN